MGYKKDLKKYGIAEENADKVMEWAFGEFWDVMDVKAINRSFNMLHPELPQMDNEMEVKDGLGHAAKHWLETQKEAA